jgi:hypothetical protein
VSLHSPQDLHEHHKLKELEDALKADAVPGLRYFPESLFDNSHILVVPVISAEIGLNCAVELVVQVILAH